MLVRFLCLKITFISLPCAGYSMSSEFYHIYVRHVWTHLSAHGLSKELFVVLIGVWILDSEVWQIWDWIMALLCNSSVTLVGYLKKEGWQCLPTNKQTNKQNNPVMINQECCTLNLTWIFIIPTHSIHSYFLMVPSVLMMVG